jgi:hypothetical protein
MMGQFAFHLQTLSWESSHWELNKCYELPLRKIYKTRSFAFVAVTEFGAVGGHATTF